MATYSARTPVSAFTTPASTTLFRRLTWEGTVPLEIRVDSKELPANSDRGLECYYIQAPRVSYLPLLVPELKKFLMDVVFDEAAARVVKEEDWWFETDDGQLLKWCVNTILSMRTPAELAYLPGIGRSGSYTTVTRSRTRRVQRRPRPRPVPLCGSFCILPPRQMTSCFWHRQPKHASRRSWGSSRRPTLFGGGIPSG